MSKIEDIKKGEIWPSFNLEIKTTEDFYKTSSNLKEYNSFLISNKIKLDDLIIPFINSIFNTFELEKIKKIYSFAFERFKRLKPNSNLEIPTEIFSLKDITKIIQLASTKKGIEINKETRNTFGFIKILQHSAKVINDFEAVTNKEKTLEALVNFLKTDEFQVLKTEGNLTYIKLNNHNIYLYIKGPRIKTLDSIFNKAVLKESAIKNNNEHSKDLFAMTIYIKPEDFEIIFNILLSNIKKSKDASNEKLWEIKDRGMLSQKQIDFVNDLVKEKNISVKGNPNAFSKGFQNLSALWELYMPNYKENGELSEEKIKRGFEVQFLPLGYKDAGLANHDVYKSIQDLMVKYSIFGPGISKKDILKNVKEIFEKNPELKNEVSEKDVLKYILSYFDPKEEDGILYLRK